MPRQSVCNRTQFATGCHRSVSLGKSVPANLPEQISPPARSSFVGHHSSVIIRRSSFVGQSLHDPIAAFLVVGQVQLVERLDDHLQDPMPFNVLAQAFFDFLNRHRYLTFLSARMFFLPATNEWSLNDAVVRVVSKLVHHF